MRQTRDCPQESSQNTIVSLASPDSTDQSPRDVARFARLVRRETVLLVVLGGIAVVAFFGTRAAAEANRRLQRADAARWYAIAEDRLDRGDAAGAVEALRHATELDPANRTHRLGLASALRADGDPDSARAVLVRLRALAPDDARVNVQLARLQAGADPADALRFYHAALETLWEPEHEAERRRLRVEIIDFLLERGWTGRALSEVLALASDMPETPEAHQQAGDLFLRAGDPARALRQFRSALTASPQLTAAQVGAARAAFELSDYRLSRTYLRRVPAADESVANLRELVERILSIDPLTRGLSAPERTRRLLQVLDDVSERMQRCRPQLCGDAPACAEFDALTSGLELLRRDAGDIRRHESHDNVEADLAAMATLSARASAACGLPTVTARALTFVLQQYEIDQP